jgi:uncharacterized protein YaaR (DUF327 family)
MKVRDLKNDSAKVFPGRVGDQKAARIKGERGRFEENLKKEQSERMEERIAALLDGIDEQGKRMANSMDLRELLAYKTRVKAFMEEVISGMLRFTKNSSTDRRGRHRIFSLVKKINRELEELTDEMLKQQKDRFKILEKADNIKGLLIDLYT